MFFIILYYCTKNYEPPYLNPCIDYLKCMFFDGIYVAYKCMFCTCLQYHCTSIHFPVWSITTYWWRSRLYCVWYCENSCNLVWIIFCLPGTLIPACLGINHHISNRLNGICKYIKERKIQCYVIWKTSDFIFLLCVCVCVCTFTIDTLHEYGQVEFTLTCLLTKVVSENPRLKLWENFMTK